MTTTLDDDGVWAAIDLQRREVAGLLDRLGDDEWDRPSLCDGWTVRDVAAHLTLQQLTWRQALAMMARYRGNTDRAIAGSARERAAAFTPDQLTAQIRATAGSRRHNAGVTCRETLIDALVHGQDIALAVDRVLPVPPRAAAEATTRMWTMRFPPPLPATRVIRQFRLTATDIDWTMGEGAAIEGPIGAIMLVSAGRLVALDQLSGPGLAELTRRLTRR